MTGELPIKIDNISKAFKEKKVLFNLSFHVRKGEIFGLIGLNGAGKTTLIKIMLDLLNADEGHVHFFDVPKTNPTSRKHLHYLPEKFTPSPLLKGREFLELSCQFYHKKYRHNEAVMYADKLGLDSKFLDSRVNKYSKGMGQKLGLLSAFMAESPLLILDEPMSGLDPSARIQLKELLKSHRAAGHTTFFSSHILSDLDEICDRIAVLHLGKLLFIGTPAEFKANYNIESLERAFLHAIKPVSS